MTGLLDLPSELIHWICEDLAKADIKRLRLVCNHLAERVDLRIERIYLSPNRANLETFDNIVNHPRWKHLVREIVWDDAQLSRYETIDTFRAAVNGDPETEDRTMNIRLNSFLANKKGETNLVLDDFFENGYLTEIAKRILLSQANDKYSWNIIARNSCPLMAIEASYELYQKLYEEEKRIIATGDDVRALHLALSSFPRLKRITLTSEVWRPWFNPPIYVSPFFRSLSPGFRKPYVWPWLGPNDFEDRSQREYRRQTMAGPVDKLSSDWRGYSIVVSALLAVPNHKVNELVIDVQGGELGISHQLFSSRNEDYIRTLDLMSTVPLRRFQLALNRSYAHCDGFACFFNGLMKLALESMTHLEHFEFNANYSTRGEVHLPEPIPLQAILPTSDCAFRKLIHLGLRNLATTEDSLITLLHTLPALRSILLDHVDVPRPTTYITLLHRLRQELVDAENGIWRQTKPHFVYCERSEHFVQGSLNRVVYDEMDEFLYRGGECPFEDTGRVLNFSGQSVELKHGIGYEIDEQSTRDQIRHGEKNSSDKLV